MTNKEIIQIALQIQDQRLQMGVDGTDLESIVKEITGEKSINNKSQIGKRSSKMSESSWKTVNGVEQTSDWDMADYETETTSTVTSPGKGAVEFAEPEKPKGGIFFKRTAPEHFLRFYTFLHEGKTKLTVQKKLHWEGNKSFPCTGEGCEKCKVKAPQTKYSVNMVDRKVNPPKALIWDMPSTVCQWLHSYHASSGDSIFGNEGRTFKLNYDETKKTWTIMPFEKDNRKLDVHQVHDLLAPRV